MSFRDRLPPSKVNIKEDVNRNFSIDQIGTRKIGKGEYGFSFSAPTDVATAGLVSDVGAVVLFLAIAIVELDFTGS